MPDDQHLMQQYLMMQQQQQGQMGGMPMGADMSGMAMSGVPNMNGMMAERPIRKPVQPGFSGPKGGTQPCSIHGKKRGMANLKEDGAGGFCCAPGFECQVSPAEGGPRKKFKICQHWQQGRCGKGTACTFAHGEEEIGAIVDPNAIADGGKLVLSGDWYCPGCNDHQFARNTECRKCGQPNPNNGGVGNNVGGAWPLEQKMVGDVAPGEPTMACALHGTTRGVMSLTSDGLGGVRCKPGMECNAVALSAGGKGAPSFYSGKKWKMCMYFEQGACQKGVACDFAHSPEEMGQASASGGKGGGKDAGARFAPY